MIPCAPRPWQQGGQPVTPPHRTGTGLVLPLEHSQAAEGTFPYPPCPPLPRGWRKPRKPQAPALQRRPRSWARGRKGPGGSAPHVAGGALGGVPVTPQAPGAAQPPPSSQRSGANAEHPAGTGDRAWRAPGPAAHSRELAPRGQGQGHGRGCASSTGRPRRQVAAPRAAAGRKSAPRAESRAQGPAAAKPLAARPRRQHGARGISHPH